MLIEAQARLRVSYICRMKTSLPLLLSIALLSGCASTSDLERARALGQAVEPDHPFAESAFGEPQDLRLH